jgi:hypothetical protein
MASTRPPRCRTTRADVAAGRPANVPEVDVRGLAEGLAGASTPRPRLVAFSKRRLLFVPRDGSLAWGVARTGAGLPAVKAGSRYVLAL